MGKEGPDQKVEILQFDTAATGKHPLVYTTTTSINDTNLTQLRLEYKLDSLVKNCTSEFEKVTTIQSWVQSRWQHDGNNAPAISDARFILREAEKGKRFRCVEYSIVAGECLAALVPLMQQAAVDYIADPSKLDSILADLDSTQASAYAQ